MLRDGELPLRLIDGRAFLDLLGPQDEPWLRVLIGEMARFEGRRARELTERLAEPLGCETPFFKRRAAARVLWRLWRRERTAAFAPALLRETVFAAAAASACGRTTLLEGLAKQFDMNEADLMQSLFADVPAERSVRAPAPLPTTAEVVLHTNLAIAQSVLMRAASVDLRLEGGVRPIVRLAKLRGLLCTVIDDEAESVDGRLPGPRGPVLQISGPVSLFRHTLVYGRALAELLPRLAWCARFELRAACALRGRLADVVLASGDPIFPSVAPREFDSRLEERFARDFGRIAPDWDLIREPEAVRSGPTLIFPDFLLRHRFHPQRQVMLEILGYWTPAYVAAKLARLRAAELGPFVLCVDDERGCAAADLPKGISILRFRRRLEAAVVLREVERVTS